MRTIVTVRPRRPSPVLVCRKCLKRVDDGRAIRRALKAELKVRSKAESNAGASTERGKMSKPPKLVLTGCFGICPKRAVTIASGATLARGEFVLVADKNQVKQGLAALTPPNS